MSYSELGRGSTFKVYFAASSGISPNRGVIRIKPTPHGTETVLLVEDEDQVRTILRQILENQGYHVLSASRQRSPGDLTKTW